MEVTLKWPKFQGFPNYESHNFVNSYFFHMNFNWGGWKKKVVAFNKIFPTPYCMFQSKVISTYFFFFNIQESNCQVNSWSFWPYSLHFKFSNGKWKFTYNIYISRAFKLWYKKLPICTKFATNVYFRPKSLNSKSQVISTCECIKWFFHSFIIWWFTSFSLSHSLHKSVLESQDTFLAFIFFHVPTLVVNPSQMLWQF